MLNINEYINSTEEIQIKDVTVNVYDLTIPLYNECCEPIKGLSVQELYTKRAELALKILNRNEQKHVFEKEYVLSLPLKAIEAILITMIQRARMAATDPN